MSINEPNKSLNLFFKFNRYFNTTFFLLKQSLLMKDTVSVPCVDFSTCTTTGVEWKVFFNVVTAVEAEAMALTVGSTLQLLQQEDNRIMDDPEHPRATHHTQRQLLQVAA